MTTKRATYDDEQQSKLFIEKARELGADREASADTVMDRLARTPPKPHVAQKAKGRKRVKRTN